MKALGNRLKEGIIKKASSYRNWVFENWTSYTLLKNALSMLLLPLIYLLGLIPAIVSWFPTIVSLVMVVFFLLLVESFFLDSKRISVAEKRPADFIKAEGVEHFSEILFFVLPPLWLTLLVIFGYHERIGIPQDIVSFFQTFMLVLILAWTGLFFSVEINVIESSRLMKLVEKRFKSRDKWNLLAFYPSENVRARTRFIVVGDSLCAHPRRKTVGRKFNLFFQGLRIYNDHLKDDFGFVLREPKRLYLQAKLAASSKDHVSSIRNGLESLIELMKDENTQPFGIIKSIKEMLNEPASFKEVCSEIDADPNRIGKWFSVHSNTIIGVVGIILGVAELSYFLLFH